VDGIRVNGSLAWMCGCVIKAPAYCCTGSVSMRGRLRNKNTELVIIPSGMTSRLQPLDVSINRPFSSLSCLSKDNHTTPCGKTKSNSGNNSRMDIRSSLLWVNASCCVYNDKIGKTTTSFRNHVSTCITSRLTHYMFRLTSESSSGELQNNNTKRKL
jgi:hypothetical protein